jgi:hypothetical protein
VQVACLDEIRRLIEISSVTVLGKKGLKDVARFVDARESEVRTHRVHYHSCGCHHSGVYDDGVLGRVTCLTFGTESSPVPVPGAVGGCGRDRVDVRAPGPRPSPPVQGTRGGPLREGTPGHRGEVQLTSSHQRFKEQGFDSLVLSLVGCVTAR